MVFLFTGQPNIIPGESLWEDVHSLVEADVLEDLEPAHKHIEPKDPNLIIERKKYRKAFQ